MLTSKHNIGPIKRLLSARQIHKITNKAKGSIDQAVWDIMISFSNDFVVI